MWRIIYEKVLTHSIICATINDVKEFMPFICGSGSVVERHLAKVNVASSNLVFRSIQNKTPIGVSCFVYIGADDEILEVAQGTKSPERATERQRGSAVARRRRIMHIFSLILMGVLFCIYFPLCGGDVPFVCTKGTKKQSGEEPPIPPVSRLPKDKVCPSGFFIGRQA